MGVSDPATGFSAAHTQNYDQVTLLRRLPGSSNAIATATTSSTSSAPISVPPAALPDTRSPMAQSPPFIDRSVKIPMRTGSNASANLLATSTGTTTPLSSTATNNGKTASSSKEEGTPRRVYSMAFTQLQSIPYDGRIYDDIRQQLDLSNVPADAIYAMPDELTVHEAEPAVREGDAASAQSQDHRVNRHSVRSIYSFLWPDEPKDARNSLPKGMSETTCCEPHIYSHVLIGSAERVRRLKPKSAKEARFSVAIASKYACAAPLSLANLALAQRATARGLEPRATGCSIHS